MVARDWLRPPRRILSGFLAVVVVCVGALAWLGHQLLRQDRALESQRLQEQLEHAADVAAAALERRVVALEGSLDGPPRGDGLPDGAILVVAGAREVERYGSVPLLFYPEPEAPPEAPRDGLRVGERIEFQEGDPLRAAAVFQEVARSRDPRLRAAALVRLGRAYRKAGRADAALDAYSELGALGATPVLGLPAELVAQEARCTALDASGRKDDLRREATALLRDLEGGRWRLTRSAYEFRADEARRWIGDGSPPTPPAEALALSEAVEVLVTRWRSTPEASVGRQLLRSGSVPVLAVWRASPARLAVACAGPRSLAALGSGAVPGPRMRLALTDSAGDTVLGSLPASSAPVAVRTAAVTKLPFTLHLAAADPAEGGRDTAGRRRLLLAGLSILAVLLVVSSHLIARAMTRELALARLRSDFVASVSHEFRSPLTSIRQLSSLLGQGRLASEEQRRRAYDFLAAESGRLERMIEGILDLGQIEAGGFRCRLESIDAAGLVRDVVEEFRRTVSPEGYRVQLVLPGSSCPIRGDREALGRALWNLLDNAVKYSPVNRTVRVDVVPDEDRVAISVMDRGVGIPASEQKAVFGRFVRGARSREAGVRGTGIGLAIVEHVVTAHGGEVRLESTPGEGSRFTLVIPREQEP